MCTTDALQEMLHEWCKATDYHKICVRVRLVDDNKALLKFDLINHDILTSKLTNSGVSITYIVRWVASFLLNRTPRVKVDDVYSLWISDNGGVPHGTVSGPENFVSDLDTPCPMYKCVDDFTLCEIVKPALKATYI